MKIGAKPKDIKNKNDQRTQVQHRYIIKKVLHYSQESVSEIASFEGLQNSFGKNNSFQYSFDVC